MWFVASFRPYAKYLFDMSSYLLSLVMWCCGFSWCRVKCFAWRLNTLFDISMSQFSEIVLVVVIDSILSFFFLLFIYRRLLIFGDILCCLMSFSPLCSPLIMVYFTDELLLLLHAQRTITWCGLYFLWNIYTQDIWKSLAYIKISIASQHRSMESYSFVVAR